MPVPGNTWNRKERSRTGCGRATRTLIPANGPQEHVVAVRVYDRYDNVGSEKIVVR